jgi:hypothetical protein
MIITTGCWEMGWGNTSVFPQLSNAAKVGEIEEDRIPRWKKEMGDAQFILAIHSKSDSFSNLILKSERLISFTDTGIVIVFSAMKVRYF